MTPLERLLGWIRSLFSRKDSGEGWVEPSSSVTRVVLALDEPLILAKTAAELDSPPVIELPDDTREILERAAAEEEAAARAAEEARGYPLLPALQTPAGAPDPAPEATEPDAEGESRDGARRPAASQADESAEPEDESGEPAAEEQAAQAA